MVSARDELNRLEDELAQEKAAVAAVSKKDRTALDNWNHTTDPVEEKKYMDENIKLHSELMADGNLVAETRSKIHALEGEVKDEEFDDFADSQLERELETGIDERVE